MGATRRRWPLILIGAAAGTSTWSGWVGLGSLTGFGVIHPLPGILDDVKLNTAITLPIGVEAYAVYALAVATGREPLTGRARRYAWASAGGALGLGMLGQVAYHVMAANGVTAAPWQVVALVSCLPVLVLGAASLLWHLAGEVEQAESVPGIAPVEATEPAIELARAPEPATIVAPSPEPAQPTPKPRPATDAELTAVVATVLGGNAKAGRGAVVKALADRGLTPGPSERLASTIASGKRSTIHAVADAQAL